MLNSKKSKEQKKDKIVEPIVTEKNDISETMPAIDYKVKFNSESITKALHYFSYSKIDKKLIFDVAVTEDNAKELFNLDINQRITFTLINKKNEEVFSEILDIKLISFKTDSNMSVVYDDILHVNLIFEICTKK